MTNTEKPESLLVADIGSVITKVGLVDRVGNEYRFISVGASPTTAEPPVADVIVGVRRAVQQIEMRTNRRFLTEDGQLVTPERASGQGVDAFAAITSAATPLRVAIVGLSREVSVASAICGVHATYATVEATLAIDETGGRWLRRTVKTDAGGDDKSETPSPDPAVIAAEALATANPEVIILVGGMDGGATTALYELANLIAAIAASREEGARPVIIFAGNREARSQIASRLGSVGPLRMVDNVHPSSDRENPAALKRELETLYTERKLARLPGLAGLNGWTQQPVIPAAHAFENVVRYLSRRYGLDVLGADIGGTTTVVSRAHGDTVDHAARADLGIGYSLDSLLKQAGSEALLQWLPFELSADELTAAYLEHAARPTTIPETRAEARVQQIAARYALSTTAKDCGLQSQSVDLVVLTGGLFAFNSDYGAQALLGLDAFQPRGVMTIAVDGLGLAPAFGALAALNPEAAASVIERDGFVTLGTVIAPVSENRDGQVDMHVQVQPSGGGAIELDVVHGSLEVVPLAPGQKATLQVRLAKGVDLGPTRRGVFKADVEGGATGLIIDARGRPLNLPTGKDQRRDKVQQWYWDVGS